jgi:outer membrane protein insertion porin family
MLVLLACAPLLARAQPLPQTPAETLAVDEAGPRPGDPVAEVRLDLPAHERERYLRYVELAPGRPYDHEDVRRAVELLYATGAFEDVHVQAEATPDGWVFNLTPRPAPRLATVRVRGDAVLTPRALRRAARLGPAEVLFPARLERAARDVALALAAQGWLEARVTAQIAPSATGADAAFHVIAGPRAHVASLRFEGLSTADIARLRPLAGPVPGATFRRAQAAQAAERLRRALVERGHWRASVSPRETYDPRTGGVALVFEVAPGPVLRLEFQGTRLPLRLRRAIGARLRDGALSNDAIEEGVDRIDSALRALGHREASVSHREEPRPDGLALVYDVQAGAQATVHLVRLLGADAAQPPLSTFLPGTRAGLPLRESTVEADVRVLRAMLHERGYAEATVEAELPDGGGALPVTLRVRLGPRSLVGAVTVDSPTPLPSPEPAPTLRCRAGQPYRLADVAADAAALGLAWRNAGHLHADVRPEVEFSDDHAEVGITLRVHPGPRTLVERVVVAGLRHTREEVVRRELQLEPGGPLGFERLLESQRRLGTLGILRRASLRELDPEQAERRSLVVLAEEAPATTLAYGVGYAEREQLRGSLEVTRRNLFGLDRTLTLFGRASFKGSRALATFREPYFFGRRQDFFVTAFREGEDRVSFDFTRLGGLVQTALALRARTSLILRFQYQKTDLFNVDVPLDEIDRQFRSSTTAGPSVALIHDTRDDALDPHAGRFIGADVQVSQRFLGGDRFVKGFIQGSSYQRVGPRLLLALNARLGLARTFGRGEPTRLPLPDRFFAGGDYSLRGFRTDTVGPLEASDTDGRFVPSGGNALLLGALEWRFDATRFFSVALFTDAGNVFAEAGDLSLSRLRYTAGFGVRYKSALGPLRVDWGFKLDRRRPGEAPSRLHVTIGHAF